MSFSEPVDMRRRPPPTAQAPVNHVRSGFWLRWVFGVLALVTVGQAFVAVVAASIWTQLLPWAMIDAGVALATAFVALLVAPGVAQVPDEARLRLEEWVATGAPPES